LAGLTVFAGPNGSGKTSIIQLLDFDGKANLLEADAIAKRINPSSPPHAAVAAGREVLRRTKEYLSAGEDFGIETTLAGSWTNTVIRSALQSGFFVKLIFICVDNPERSIQRVRERVAQGGHDVPENGIRRRYSRSLLNVRKVMNVVNQSLSYANSGTTRARRQYC